MEEIVLKDRLVEPNEEIVAAIIGDKILLWQQIISYLHDHYKDISEVWRFYNDGKSWLFRTLQKKKTIFWIAVFKDSFRVAFYFGDKAEPLIEQSDLPERIKEQFRTAKRYNVIRGLPIDMADSSDVENVKKLIAIKMKLK